MPASGASMTAPFGRVTSGRGFAPSSYQPHELPAAGQFTKDLPNFRGNQPNRESWFHQAKAAQGLQGIARAFDPNQIPSAIPGLRSPNAADDMDVHHPAKRARHMLPDYGRSASDPPYSFHRREGHAMNIPVDALKMAAMKPAGAQLPKSLRSVQSGPARVADGHRPSPNYRIYSNEFLGRRVNGEGGPLNYSHPKATMSSVASVKSSSSQLQPSRPGPTPHPAFLKQPLVSQRPEQGSSPTAHVRAASQQPDQVSAAESQLQEPKEAGQKVQAELDARLQQMQSTVRGQTVSSSNPQLRAKSPSPQPASSSKHSISHSSPSDEDTEMDEASPESRGTAAAAAAAAASQGALPRAAADSPRASPSGDVQGQDRVSEVPSEAKPAAPAGSSQSPVPDPWDSAIPSAKDAAAVAREGEKKRKSLDSKDSKGSSRKPGPAKASVIGKARPARPWSNLSSALQPSVSPRDKYTQAQLQALMADVMRKNGTHRDGEALTNMTEANIQQLLQQLSDMQGCSSGHSSGLSSISSQEQFLAGHSNVPRQPLQAQLHVMRNSFNRVTRPESENSSFPPNHPAAASSAFMPSGFPPQGQDHHRGFVLPNQDSGNPRVGSARNFQHRPLVPISSSTLSSLPQSVAAYYEHEQRQHQQPQASSQGVGLIHSGLSFTHQLPQHVAQHHSTAPMPQTDPSLGQYPYSSGDSRGYTQSNRPLDSHHIGSKGWNDTLGSDSGYMIPSGVVPMDASRIRNPALLNRPVRASHRDPQLNPVDQDLGYMRGDPRQQASSRASEYLSRSAAQHAQRTQHELDHSARGASFGSGPPRQQDSHNSSLHALGAALSNPNLSAADMAQLCSYAGGSYAGNLNQLITQLQMVNQLAQNQTEPAQPLVETTHRVVIPTAHLKEGSLAIARQAAAPLAKMRNSNSGPTVSDVGNRVTQQQPARAVGAAPAPMVQSALDVVAEAAAAEAANEEPSELLMLAAETLAGLNNMHPRSSPDQTKLAPSSLDHVTNDSPAAARKLSKQLGDANRKQRRKLAQAQKAATPAAITAAAVHASSGSASVHPILGFSVPHARRSYRSDVTPTPAKSGPSAHSTASEAKHASGELQGSELRDSELRDCELRVSELRRRAPAPASGQQRKPGAMSPQARPSFTTELPRVASDSSITVSADST